MAEALTVTLKSTLPDELVQLLAGQLQYLEQGKYHDILTSRLAKLLFGHDQDASVDQIVLSDFSNWSDYIFHRLGIILANRNKISSNDGDSPSYRQHFFILLALAALQAFLQSNATGPPLPFSSAKVLFPPTLSEDKASINSIKAELIRSLNVDGVAAYKLTPNIELFCLADTILTSPAVKKNVKVADWVALRVQFVHQRLLSETTAALQSSIYEQLVAVDKLVAESSHDVRSQWLLEKAAIHTHHGFDKLARHEIDKAKDVRRFDFALTGLLGKRTKWQEKETSQLVVLARSYEGDTQNETATAEKTERDIKPEALNLNDDTLLEAISFSTPPKSTADFQDPSALPASLSSLDPSNQPLLHPVDSILLLSLASSITNTSPADGLTREETLPYAVRVLDGGSSNWQIYTQALLVRSRIDGHRSRTTERGLLQLQALVDQVIAETTASSSPADAPATNTFLPRPQASESAPASERLAYIYLLASPLRWDLEAELAARWVSLGGLRSALDIYERLELWAEAALCWAAVDREDRARKTVRRQLFHRSTPDPILATATATVTDNDNDDPDGETWSGPPRDPPPLDAPRLYCILGDLDKDTAMYERAWDVSGGRYARAQRSLGRHYIGLRDYVHAAAAYSKALKANQLNGGSWFALGCALLELSEFERAAEAFSRTVQLDDSDAEAWSNLAAALLRKGPTEVQRATPAALLDDEDAEGASAAAAARQDPQRHKRDALVALKKAAALKRESFRIWDNLLTVAATLEPPAYADIVAAMQRIVALRGAAQGEACVDVDVLALLVRFVVRSFEAGDAVRPGLARMVVQMVDGKITPLITSSRRLWQLVAALALWRGKTASALAAHEKAWRAVTTGMVGWEAGTEAQWDEVVDVTVELVDAYESLGPKERGEGLGADEVVMKDWRFKARSAARGIMGKGKGSWEGTKGWERLVAKVEELKSV